MNPNQSPSETLLTLARSRQPVKMKPFISWSDGTDGGIWEMDDEKDQDWIRKVRQIEKRFAEDSKHKSYPGPHPSGYHRPGGGPGGSAPRNAASSPDFDFINAAQSGKESTSSKLGGGTNYSVLVEYEGDGSGVWKEIGNKRGNMDHCGYNEVLAYRVSELLGLGLVPPTVLSRHKAFGRIDPVEGSSQKFVDGFTPGEDVEGVENDNWENANPSENNAGRFADTQEFWDMALLDNLIGNHDRHTQNWGADADGKLVAIDHGHATRMNIGRGRTFVRYGLKQRKIQTDRFKKWAEVDRKSFHALFKDFPEEYVEGREQAMWDVFQHTLEHDGYIRHL